VSSAPRWLPVTGATGRPATELVFDGFVLAAGAAGLVRTWIEPLPPRPAVSGLALLASLPLLLRRRFPVAAPMVGLLGCLGLSLLVPGALWEQLQFFFCALLCAWALGSVAPRSRAPLGLAVLLPVVLGTVATDPGHAAVSDYVFGVAIATAAWAGGAVFGARSRQAAAAERAAAEERARAALAVATERARIARELHDLVAHSVSLIVVQAGAADQVLGAGQEEVRAALGAIRETVKSALLELRRMLGLLQDGSSELSGAPQPTLADLDELVARLAAAGAEVHMVRSGTARPLSPGLEQASYRIVQEALSNALKHAGRAPATVDIRWEPDALVLAVTDDGGDHAQRAPVPGSGRGIIGMRERARLYGGELTAGPRPDGGFAVRARLPT
jgi:signal transduction histidine kinase